MAAAGTISTVFDLAFDVAQNTGGSETYTISSLDGARAFRVLEVLAYNAGGTGNLSVTNATTSNTIVAAAATVNGGWKSMATTTANLEVGVGDAIAFTINGAAGFGAGSKVIIRCITALGGTALAVTTP